MKTLANNILLIAIAFICSLPYPLRAQSDSLAQAPNESVIAEQAVLLKRRLDSVAQADSINRILLLKQLENLKSTERSKRKILEDELSNIKRKDSLRRVQMLDEIMQLKKQAKAFPIQIHKDTLFYIYTKIGTISASERAKLITARLNELYQNFIPSSDSLQIVNNGQSSALYFKDKIILSTTEMDEMWHERPHLELTNSLKTKISSDIIQYKKDKSLLKKIKEIGLAVLVVLLQILLIKLINRFFRAKLNVLIWKKRGIWFHGIKIRNNEIFNADKQASAILFILKLFRYALILILLYISIPLVFSIFPLTERLAALLFEYTINPLKSIALAIINYIPELITIIVIVTVTRYILKFLRYLSQEVEAENFHLPGFYPDWAKPTFNIVRILVLAFMFVVIFPYLPGSDSAVFKGVSVFIGVVFSLSSSSIIGNMVAGLVITYMRPFQLGDRIKIGDVVGNVVEKTPFVTRVRTPKKEFITIPNSNILLSNVVNYSNSKKQGGLVLHTTVTIGYDVPWRQVHQILINAAKKTSNLNMEIAPFVLQTSLDDFYVSYQLNAHTNLPDKTPQIYSELHQNIQDGFNEAGIEILSPHYRAARDGNMITIPEKYRPENYKPTGFIIDPMDSNKK